MIILTVPYVTKLLPGGWNMETPRAVVTDWDATNIQLANFIHKSLPQILGNQEVNVDINLHIKPAEDKRAYYVYIDKKGG